MPEPIRPEHSDFCVNYTPRRNRCIAHLNPDRTDTNTEIDFAQAEPLRQDGRCHYPEKRAIPQNQSSVESAVQEPSRYQPNERHRRG